MRGRAPRRRTAAAIAVLLAAGACSGGAGPGEGILTARDVAGRVSYRSEGGAWRALRSGQRLPAGTEVKTELDGSVRLVAEDTAVELARASQVRIDGTDRFGVVTGSVLGEGALTLEDLQQRVTAQGTGRGHFRLDRRLSLRVATYEEEVRVAVPPAIRLPRLREIVIAAGVLQSREPRPLTLVAQDRWDIRLLGDVLALERDIRSYRRGFDATYAGQATTPEFFARFLPPAGAAAFVGPALAELTPSDVLLGLLFAITISGRDATPVAQGFARVVDLRRQGASWGIVAAELRLDPATILKALALAVARGSTAPRPAGGGGSSPRPRATSSPSPSPTSSPTPKPSRSPSPSPSPSPCSVIDQLLGGCPG